MGTLKNFVEELSKHKLLVYFAILWGATLLLNTTYGLVRWGFDGFEWEDASVIIDMLFHFSELFAGVILVILGVKLLSANFLKAVKKEKLLAVFLILWAASFFFRGIWSFVYYGPEAIDFPEVAIALLGGLAALFAGVALALFGWKMLSEPES